jgi:hypothetical protein
LEALTYTQWSQCLAKLQFFGDVPAAIKWVRDTFHRPCGGTEMWEPLRGILRVDDIYRVGPGDLGGVSAFVLPENVGINLGADGFKSLGIRIHYDNVREDIGVRDSSGVVAYFTTQPRQYRAGVLQLGDSSAVLRGTKLQPTSIRTPLVEHTFVCPSRVTQEALGGSAITVFGSFKHMQRRGVFMSTTVNGASGGEQQHLSKREYYDANYQSYSTREFEVRGGDSLQTRCVYKSATSAAFGLGMDGEMCVDFLLYYPKSDILTNQFQGACGVEIKESALGHELLNSGVQLHRVGGIVEPALDLRFSKNVSSICPPDATATTTAASDTSENSTGSTTQTISVASTTTVAIGSNGTTTAAETSGNATTTAITTAAPSANTTASSAATTTVGPGVTTTAGPGVTTTAGSGVTTVRTTDAGGNNSSTTFAGDVDTTSAGASEDSSTQIADISCAGAVAAGLALVLALGRF